jgi:hypothetical protein
MVYGRLVVAEAFAGLHPILVTPWGYLVGLRVSFCVSAPGIG